MKYLTLLTCLIIMSCSSTPPKSEDLPKGEETQGWRGWEQFCKTEGRDDPACLN